MGAGILPCAYHRGKLYILLGRERKNGLWCDFGGSPERGESIFETAIREGMEELNGFFGTKDELSSQVKKTQLQMINNPGDKYTSILFKIKYDPKLPKYFNYNNRFVEENVLPFLNSPAFGHIRPQHSGLFEKTEIRWFNIQEIENLNTKSKIDKIDEKKNINTGFSIFRPHFAVILLNIIKKKSNIIDKITAQNTFNKNRTRKKLEPTFIRNTTLRL